MRGYAKLGLLMGNFPEAAIFRRFSTLSARNLLYMQAELRSLEVRLQMCGEEDDNSLHEDRRVYSLDWFALKNSGGESAEEGNDCRQWQTVLEIREKLEVYRICEEKALLRHQKVASLSEPIRRDLTFLNCWMQRTDMGNVYLHGDDKDLWVNNEWRHDLTSLRARGSDDAFFHWIYQTVIDCFNHILGRHVQEPGGEEHLAGTIVYREATILRWTKILTTTMACVIPVASIVLLYLVGSMSKRLGIVAAFTVLFSFALATMTNAAVADIFAATAAYAAVQVVFIGTSNLGNSTLPGVAASHSS